LQVPRTLPQNGGMLPAVRNAVAVTSAKGGVGKSTVCVNLALSLANMGAKVGILDADIYGPSIPMMMGSRELPEMGAGDKILPILKHGVALMSVGFVTEQETPVVWRGPLLAQAVQHFLAQVEWGELDFLLIDLPPGTGDIPLTLSQQIALSGVVVVTTPQDVALEDVERGIAMFERVEVDVIGLVENMSYFICPHCSEEHEIFGRHGGREMAAKLNLRFLGEIPLEPGIRAGGDRGEPVVLTSAEAEESRVFGQIATGIVEEIHALAEDG